MQIGRLALLLGVSGIILITAACSCNVSPMEQPWETVSADRSSQISMLNDHRLPHRNGLEGRVIIKRDLPWMPDPMKVLVRRLGNG